MEETIRIAAACVLTALLAVLLKKGTPELALLLTVGAAVAALVFLGGFFETLLDFLDELAEKTNVDPELFVPLYKTVGIALVVRVGGNLCRDAGESGLASVLETAGTVCALLVALPLLRTALTLLMELMNG